MYRRLLAAALAVLALGGATACSGNRDITATGLDTPSSTRPAEADPADPSTTTDPSSSTAPEDPSAPPTAPAAGNTEACNTINQAALTYMPDIADAMFVAWDPNATPEQHALAAAQIVPPATSLQSAANQAAGQTSDQQLTSALNQFAGGLGTLIAAAQDEDVEAINAAWEHVNADEALAVIDQTCPVT